MNVRSAVTSVSLVLSTLLGAVACGPKEPPRQANIPDPQDPSGEEATPTAANPSSGSSGNKGGDPLGSPPPAGKVVKGHGGEAPQVSSLNAFTDGVKWGIGHAELTKQFTQTGGVIWKDYDERLQKARVGPEQAALEAERDQTKAAFGRSFIEFKDTPTGYDSTGIRGEYTYKNKESLMWVQRQGKKRYFFFINDRLWKMYDEVPLVDGGALGKTFVEAVNTLNAQLNAQGRVQKADPAKGISANTVDWKDGSTHLRAVDRSDSGMLGLVVEDLSTLSNLASLRTNKLSDPNEIDPSITAVTGGTNRTDPNAAAAPAASASGGKKGAPPPKKK